MTSYTVTREDSPELCPVMLEALDGAYSSSIVCPIDCPTPGGEEVTIERSRLNPARYLVGKFVTFKMCPMRIKEFLEETSETKPETIAQNDYRSKPDPMVIAEIARPI